MAMLLGCACALKSEVRSLAKKLGIDLNTVKGTGGL